MASEGTKLLDQLLPGFKAEAEAFGYQKPNLFLMASDSAFGVSADKFRRIKFACESAGLTQHTFTKFPKDHPLTAQMGFAPTVTFLALAVDTGRIEVFRDALKSALWPDKAAVKRTFNDVLRGLKLPTRRNWALRRHGLFSPYKLPQTHTDGIRVHSFGSHQPYYRYRLAQTKLNSLPPLLTSYLTSLFENTPNHLFTDTALRASQLTSESLATHIRTKKVSEHELSLITCSADGDGSVNSRHEILEKYALLNDPKTVACEVPVWMEPEEISDFATVFGRSVPLTGHIDFLRAESSGKIGVWDYKPYAYGEQTAHIQVFIYAFLLSIRTGISLSAFTCGYFDESLAYTFEPALGASLGQAQ